MGNIGNELQKYIDIDYYYFIENIVDEYVALFDEKTLAREDMYEFIIYENKNFVIDNEKLKKVAKTIHVNWNNLFKDETDLDIEKIVEYCLYYFNRIGIISKYFKDSYTESEFEDVNEFFEKETNISFRYNNQEELIEEIEASEI